MSKIEVDAIEPQSGTSLTLGASGDTITVPAGATFDSSAATNTLPATVVTTTGTQTLTNKSIATTQLTGTVATSNLGTGTADATTFLRGDQTFDVPPLGGITMADQWRRTAAMTITSTAQVLSANWEQVDTSGQGTIGSSMTQSSGIFTFPSTGLYFITVNQNYYDNSSDSRYFEFKIEGTVDNSSYALQSRMTSSLKYISSNTYSMLTCNTFFNVTDTSLCKIRFTAESENNTIIGGDTAFNESQSYTFIRLGDSV